MKIRCLPILPHLQRRKGRTSFAPITLRLAFERRERRVVGERTEDGGRTILVGGRGGGGCVDCFSVLSIRPVPVFTARTRIERPTHQNEIEHQNRRKSQEGWYQSSLDVHLLTRARHTCAESWVDEDGKGSGGATMTVHWACRSL